MIPAPAPQVQASQPRPGVKARPQLTVVNPGRYGDPDLPQSVRLAPAARPDYWLICGISGFVRFASREPRSGEARGCVPDGAGGRRVIPLDGALDQTVRAIVGMEDLTGILLPERGQIHQEMMLVRR